MVFWIEPIFFMFFGLFHLHRIWAFLDRGSYAAFWLSMMDNRGWFYYTLMGILAVLCIIGVILFLKYRERGQWWRWIYVFGGAYVLFDLFAIVTGFELWRNLLYWMFGTDNPAWNILWGGFVFLGAVSFCIGVWLLKRLMKQK